MLGTHLSRLPSEAPFIKKKMFDHFKLEKLTLQKTVSIEVSSVNNSGLKKSWGNGKSVKQMSLAVCDVCISPPEILGTTQPWYF